MNSVENAHAFVTGGANGIGLAIARALVGAGATVTIADIDKAACDKACEGTGLNAVTLDVRDRAGWATARKLAEDGLGPVDILINNAGIGPDGRTLADTEPEAFDRIVALDLVSVFNGISAFAGSMRDRRRGHIVNNASLAGLVGFPKVGAYCAAKFGVVGMSEALRQEMEPFGVGVSLLCPGPVATKLRETTLAAGSEASPDLLGEQPAGSDPQEIGDLVLAAIRTNQFYILPHGDLRARVEGRHRRIEAAFG